MSLRILPIAALGAVALGALTIVTSLLEEDTTPKKVDSPDYLKNKMKRINDELARLSDIKMLNDKRESTKQVSKVDLMIDGVEINELIQMLEEELSKVVKEYNSMYKKV